MVALGSMRVIAELQLPGRPRWALYDESRDRVYANIRDPAEIVVIDAERSEIVELVRGAERGAARSRAPRRPALLRRRWRLRSSCSTRQRRTVEQPAAPGRARRRDARRGPAAPLRGDRRTGIVCSVDTAGSSTLETVETESGAHTLGWDPAAAACTSSARDSGGARRVRGARLSSDARRIVAGQGARALVYGLGSVLIGVTLADRGLTAPRSALVLASLLAGAGARLGPARPLRRPFGRRRAYRLLFVAMALAGAVFALTGWLPAADRRRADRHRLHRRHRVGAVHLARAGDAPARRRRARTRHGSSAPTTRSRPWPAPSVRCSRSSAHRRSGSSPTRSRPPPRLLATARLSPAVELGTSSTPSRYRHSIAREES